MHSNRMHTARFSGRLSCTHTALCHIYTPPAVSPARTIDLKCTSATYTPYHVCPPPCTPLATHPPSPGKPLPVNRILDTLL